MFDPEVSSFTTTPTKWSSIAHGQSEEHERNVDVGEPWSSPKPFTRRFSRVAPEPDESQSSSPGSTPLPSQPTSSPRNWICPECAATFPRKTYLE